MSNSIIMNQIVQNIAKVILGKKETIELLTLALLCNGHVLIEDVPGVGKTLLVTALSRSIDGSFKRIQFTPDLLPSDITGFSMYRPKEGVFEYQEGAIFSNIVLADEMNRSSPKTQSSLLEVMEEYQVTVDGNTYEVPKPFMILATQNPIEQMGTYPLPEAQLDRFFMKISIGYPDAKNELEILNTYQKNNPLNTLQPVTTTEEVLALQSFVQEIHVKETLKQYIIDIVRNTRKDPNLVLGCSPRSALALLRAAQGYALYQNREYVIPDDINYLVPYILGHRVILSQEAKFKNYKPKDILLGIIHQIDKEKL